MTHGGHCLGEHGVRCYWELRDLDANQEAFTRVVRAQGAGALVTWMQSETLCVIRCGTASPRASPPGGCQTLQRNRAERIQTGERDRDEGLDLLVLLDLGEHVLEALARAYSVPRAARRSGSRGSGSLIFRPADFLEHQSPVKDHLVRRRGDGCVILTRATPSGAARPSARSVTRSGTARVTAAETLGCAGQPSIAPFTFNRTQACLLRLALKPLQGTYSRSWASLWA